MKLPSYIITSLAGFIIAFWGCMDTKLIEVAEFPHAADPTTGLYQSLSGVYTSLNQIKTQHQQKVELFQVGELTKNNHPIPLIRITNQADKKPRHYLFVAGTHGDEAIVVEAMLYTMLKISEKIEIQQLNSASFSLDFVPLHNPDGYAENERTNASGVDLNRNFPFASATDQYEPETKALVDLINSSNYDLSLFFHSANESKYNNVIRCPIEYRGKGLSVLNDSNAMEINNFVDVILKATSGIKPEYAWSVHSDLVDAGGIASDWCVSGFIKGIEKNLIRNSCEHPHPSLTIEMTFPKQPLDQLVIDQEKEEMYGIVHHLIERF